MLEPYTSRSSLSLNVSKSSQNRVRITTRSIDLETWTPGNLKGRRTTRINTMLIKRGNPASRIEACCAQLLRMQTVEIRRRFRRSSCRLQSKNIWSMASGPDENVREKGGREREREREGLLDGFKNKISLAKPSPPTDTSHLSG